MTWSWEAHRPTARVCRRADGVSRPHEPTAPVGGRRTGGATRGTTQVPYFCQWESADAAARIISGELDAADDPRWRRSGARSAREYAMWADHICGMACLKMILAARTGAVHGTIELARLALAYGAYVFEGSVIRGMIYAPFVAMVGERFGVNAQVVTGITAADLGALLQPGSLFLASVHPTIRLRTPPPPKKGGHLVLVTAVPDDAIVFHNPSGHDRRSQVDARLPAPLFDAFFAGRGVLVLP